MSAVVSHSAKVRLVPRHCLAAVALAKKDDARCSGKVLKYKHLTQLQLGGSYERDAADPMHTEGKRGISVSLNHSDILTSALQGNRNF